MPEQAVVGVIAPGDVAAVIVHDEIHGRQGGHMHIDLKPIALERPDVCDLRCGCGSLLARLVSGGVELKCRRCKRTVMLPLEAGGDHGGRNQQ